MCASKIEVTHVDRGAEIMPGIIWEFLGLLESENIAGIISILGMHTGIFVSLVAPMSD